MDSFTQFLIDHAQDDTDRLLLGRAKWPEIDMDLAVHTIGGRRRLRTKVPEWTEIQGLRYPTRLCTEQCSSAATARYKAALAARILSASPTDADNEAPRGSFSGTGQRDKEDAGAKSGRIADLTGGLGVDAWAFSAVAEEVLHNEMDPALSEAVRHNFGLLGVGNATFRCDCVAPGRIADLLGDFRPGLIYLDPARRAGDGRKVFRLEDCRPDVLSLKKELLRHAPHLLLKISPMADISLLIRQLGGTDLPGGRVREVHIVEADGECKELLVWIGRGWNGPYRLVVCRIPGTGPAGPISVSPAEGSNRSRGVAALCFDPDAESGAVPQFVSVPGNRAGSPAGDAGPLSGGWLFEPGKALSKAGLFNTLCDGTGLLKLSRHTHLYFLPPSAVAKLSAAPVAGEALPGEAPAASGRLQSILALGKLYRIREIHPFSGKTVKAVGKAWPRADVTAKDLSLSSDELRKRLGVVSDAAVHIFGCRIASGPRKTTDGVPKDPACLLVTEPVSDRTSGSPVPSTGV